MERLLIDDNVLECAKLYEIAFRGLKYDVPGDLRRLKTELDTYNTYNHLSSTELDAYKLYLEQIAEDYDNALDPSKNLLILQPSEFDDYINRYNIAGVDLKKELVYRIQSGSRHPGKEYKKKFWELIVDKMHYANDVRPIMVPIIEKLGIKTCVYCNVQYALTINHSRGLFELDHRFPKSEYPFLCTTFYNLQPSCPTCNHGKRTATSDFGLYTTNESEKNPFHLLTTPHAYLRKRRFDINKIQIHLVASDANDMGLCKLACSHEHDFDIDGTYSMLKDVAEETIWRCKAYDKTYHSMFLSRFPELYDKDALHRFIFGTYSDNQNIHQRPLSKLIRDIEKDMSVTVEV